MNSTMENKQEYVIMWRITSPPFNCKEMQLRSPNLYYCLRNENARKGQYWYINAIIKFEDLCNAASVNIEVLPSNPASIILRSMFLLDGDNKIEIDIKTPRTSFVESSIFQKCALVLMFEHRIHSEISVKPTIWLAGATNVMVTSTKNITKNFATNHEKFSIRLKIGTQQYSLHGKADDSQNLEFLLDHTPVFGGLIAIVVVNTIEGILHFNRSCLLARLLIGTRLPFSITIRDIFEVEFKPFVSVNRSSYPKIASLFSQKISAGNIIDIKQHSPALDSFTSFSKVPEMTKLFNEKRLCDVTVEVEKRQIKAHKAVLSCGSTVWHDLFVEDEKVCVIRVADFDYKTTLELIKYMYTGQVSQPYETTPILLLMASDKYGATGLKNHFETVLTTMISLETAANLLVLAHQHNAPVLFRKVIEFIRNNLAVFKNREEVEYLFVLYPNVALKMWKHFS